MRPVTSDVPRLEAPPGRGPRRIASEQLMAGRHEIIIAHGDDEYRLRLTGSGKLLLTK